MLKGINQWCYPDNTPIEQVLEKSREAGYDAVELNLYGSGGIGLTVDSTAADAERIGSLARSNGLQLRSLSTGLLWQYPLSSADAEVRAEGRRIISKQLELAELLGMDTVLVVPGAVNAATTYEQCYERSQQELRLLVKEAERRNVKIGVENVWNKFLLSPIEMARYVDELGSSHVGVYFDVGNILLYGIPEQWIRYLQHRIFKVHVKDFRTGVGNGNGFVPLLSGDVNWPAVREALQEIGYTDTLTAEVGFYKDNAWQLAFDTAQQLDVIIGKR